MKYTDLSKKTKDELTKMHAEQSEELRNLRFSMTEKNTNKSLALRRTISRIQTALKKAA